MTHVPVYACAFGLLVFEPPLTSVSLSKKSFLTDCNALLQFELPQGICYETQAFSRARVTVVVSQTSLGPKYWMAPG